MESGYDFPFSPHQLGCTGGLMSAEAGRGYMSSITVVVSAAIGAVPGQTVNTLRSWLR